MFRGLLSALRCLVLPCHVLSCCVLSVVFYCLALFCLSCLALSFPVMPCLALPCLVCPVLSCLVLSCLLSRLFPHITFCVVFFLNTIKMDFPFTDRNDSLSKCCNFFFLVARTGVLLRCSPICLTHAALRLWFSASPQSVSCKEVRSGQTLCLCSLCTWRPSVMSPEFLYCAQTTKLRRFSILIN